MKTRTQLLLWLLLALLSMAVVVAGVQGVVTYQQTSSATLNLLEHQAASLAMQTQVWFERVGQSLQFLSRQLNGKTWRGEDMEKTLSAFYHAEEGVDSLIVSDETGKILLSYPTNKKLEERGISKETYFLDTLVKKTGRTSEVIASPLTGKAAIALTRPVSLAEGPAVLVIYLNLDFLTDLSRGYWVGKSGSSVIFNSAGQSVSGGGVTDIPEEMLHRFHMDQRSGRGGEKDFYAVARAPGPEWGAAVRLSKKEVWQSSLESLPYVAGVFVMVFLVLAVASDFLVKRWVKPLQSLTAQVKVLSEGDFSADLSAGIKMRGATHEISELARIFTEMAKDLQAYVIALKEANLELEKKEERWRLAISGSSVGVWDWDIPSRKIFFSAQAKGLFGYEDDEIENTLEAWRAKAHPEERDFVDAVMDEHLEGKSDTYQVEYRFLCKDGTYRWLLARGRLLRDEAGQPLRMAGSISDVTERRRHEAALSEANEQLEAKVEQRTQELLAMNEELQAINNELQNMNAQLEQEIQTRRQVESQLESANQELSQTLENLRQTQEELIQKEKLASLSGLVAGVAHQVNTPIGVALTAATYLEQLLQQLMNEYREKRLSVKRMEEHLDDSAEGIAILTKNLQKAAALVRSFKQVASDQSSDVRRTFFLREYMNEVVVSLHANLKNQAHEIRIDADDDIRLYSYPGAVAKVISNLLSNSMQHAYAPGEKGLIEISAHQEKDSVVLTYQDDGRGIPEEIRRKIFEPFFTTQRGSGGLGLGLYVVYNTIDQILGGTIECSSDSKKGSRFIIRLPLEGIEENGKI